MKDTYYAIELEDYSIPPFCSGFTRTYAGTKGQLADFMAALSASRVADSYQPLLDAHRTWLQGGPTGVVDLDYCDCWNIRPLEVYRTAEIELPSFSTEHLNTWRWPYIFKADRVHVKCVYAKDDGKWSRFIGAAFQTLQFDSFSGDFVPVNMSWGHPGMIQRADGVTSGRLLFQERELGGKEAMLQDVASPAEIDFSGFMKDILGDG